MKNAIKILIRTASPAAAGVLCVFLFAAAVSAEVPLKFTYQGNLRQSGFLVTGQRSMNFRIYDSSDPVTGNLLWATPTPYTVSVSTGVFRVALTPNISDWQTGPMWLELEVEGNRMLPREELTSAPYAINSLMHSGKRYTTAAFEADVPAPSDGDLWMDTTADMLKFWNGTAWLETSGATPGAHAVNHSGTGSDPIVSLGTHTVTGYITVSSSVIAGWFSGDGSAITNLNADNIATGHIDKNVIGQSGCTNGQIIKWDDILGGWKCAEDIKQLSGGEEDPISIHNQSTLQANTTFYVSSGTVNDLTVNNTFNALGTSLLRGGPGQEGLTVNAAGNVGIGLPTASARLDIRGADTQAYSLAIATGTAHQVVVSTAGAVGIGTETPGAQVEIVGGEGPGTYIAIFRSGNRLAAWLRNK